MVAVRLHVAGDETVTPEQRRLLEALLDSEEAQRDRRTPATATVESTVLFLCDIALEQADRIRELESHEH